MIPRRFLRPSPYLLALPTVLVPLLLALLLGAGASALPGDGAGLAWRTLTGPGLRFDFTPQDAPLAQQLWDEMAQDRATVMERLRMFPQDSLRIVLAPTEVAFHELLGGAPPAGTLGIYLLGRNTLVLRSPRSAPGGGWDPRGVLRHELAHGIIDQGIAQPVPLWLHEGLAILVSDELDYLDEVQLTSLAVVGRLIPLPQLFDRFPEGHGARTVAYAEAASFVRFLLRDGGMGRLQALLERLARGAVPETAFQATYGEPLAVLERRWQGELAERFSYATLITTTSLLGGVGLPLLLLALARRWVLRRRAYRQWELEERLRATVRGEPPREPVQEPAPPPEQPSPSGSAPPRASPWRPPRASGPPRGNGQG